MKPHQVLARLACASLLGVIVLGVLVELWLVPAAAGGGWFALKVLPLAFALRGTWRGNPYTLQWAAMLILVYFAEGVVDVVASSGLAVWCGAAEVILTLTFFVAALATLAPLKRAARARARAAASDGTHG